MGLCVLTPSLLAWSVVASMGGWPAVPEAPANSTFYSIQAPQRSVGVPLRLSAGMSGLDMRPDALADPADAAGHFSPLAFSSLGAAWFLNTGPRSGTIDLRTTWVSEVSLEPSTTPTSLSIGYQQPLGAHWGTRLGGSYAARFNQVQVGAPWWRAEGLLWWSLAADRSSPNSGYKGPWDVTVNAGGAWVWRPELLEGGATTATSGEGIGVLSSGVGIAFYPRLGGIERFFIEGRTDIEPRVGAKGNGVALLGVSFMLRRSINIATAASYTQSDFGESLGFTLAMKFSAGGIDADGDRLPIPLDACPQEVGSEENLGCPAKDSDGDLVDDLYDACVHTPGSIRNAGCPEVDADTDGVVDIEERCLGLNRGLCAPQ